jgi:hypothetical protein
MSLLDSYEPVRFQRLRLFLMRVPFKTRLPLPLARKRSIQRCVSLWVPLLLAAIIALAWVVK